MSQNIDSNNFFKIEDLNLGVNDSSILFGADQSQSLKIKNKNSKFFSNMTNQAAPIEGNEIKSNKGNSNNNFHQMILNKLNNNFDKYDKSQILEINRKNSLPFINNMKIKKCIPILTSCSDLTIEEDFKMTQNKNKYFHKSDDLNISICSKNPPKINENSKKEKIVLDENYLFNLSLKKNIPKLSNNIVGLSIANNEDFEGRLSLLNLRKMLSYNTENNNKASNNSENKVNSIKKLISIVNKPQIEKSTLKFDFDNMEYIQDSQGYPNPIKLFKKYKNKELKNNKDSKIKSEITIVDKELKSDKKNKILNFKGLDRNTCVDTNYLSTYSYNNTSHNVVLKNKNNKSFFSFFKICFC